jgi:lipopolysaccharide/colanic/teichoic acid biosynthesis glycosyltransferase
VIVTGLELFRAAPRLQRSRRWDRVFALWPEEGGRRLVNIVVAFVGIVLTAPVMLVVAALVKLTSPGPVLYRQPRVGLDRRDRAKRYGDHGRLADQGGRPFTIYKFRTMYVDKGNGSPQIWATRNDPRVTPLGRVLRQYRLDELPQLFNVLLGEMNVVGPRPEQPAIFARLREQIPHYQERQRVRPGITGWAQINQRYDTSIADVQRKVGFDLEYVARESVLEDLRILARTVPVVLLRRGAL